MNALLGGAAAGVPAAIAADRAAPGDFRGRDAGATAELVRALLRKKRDFGITRLGSLTRLDRAGVCVAQAVRPLSLSNAVAQGKGITLLDAAASALMEALETWAGENIPVERTTTAQARHLGEDIRSLYAGCLVHAFDAGWDRLPLRWIDGYDLLGGRIVPVPAALVDTVYTLPSPHPVAFPRTTTGLAAGRTMLPPSSMRRSRSWSGPPWQRRSGGRVSSRNAGSRSRTSTCRPPPEILAGLRAADLMAGIWLVPAEHGLPTYWCHVMEGEGHRELAPLPGEGFGCDFTHDAALAKALLEACQARVTAISGAREDITRQHYPGAYERERLAEWRSKLAVAGPHAALPREARARLRRGRRSGRSSRALRGSRRTSGHRRAAFQRAPSRASRSCASSPRPSVPAPGPDGMATTSSSSSARRLRHAEAPRTSRHAIAARRAGLVRPGGASHRPRAIVLIDGVFGQVAGRAPQGNPLGACSEGVPVFGAASMGALRAAELSRRRHARPRLHLPLVSLTPSPTTTKSRWR